MGPRERHSRQRAKTHTIPIVIVSFLCFFLLTGVAFGVGMIGNINRWLQDLPDYESADAYLVSEPTTVVDCNGNKIASFFAQNRKSVTKDQVSKYVIEGTVDVEDERFYEHGGVDLMGIARAAVVTLGGGHEGASTITQQLVRNTILSDEQFTQTIERKVREAYIATKMEETYSKDDILMMYLNTIYYGHGAYGIEAASETYFSKSAKDLTLPEAALLIGLPNSPTLYDPATNPQYATNRRNKVLDNMLRLGHITQEECDKAKAEPITLNMSETSSSGINVYSNPYFVDYVRKLLSKEFSSDVVFKGGLTVKTTIDPTIQQKAEDSVKQTLNDSGLKDLQMSLVAVDPKTGYIKAMVGGRDYYADANHINYAISKRQTGSTFKAFTLATAIKEGMNPSILINCNSPLKMSSNWTVQNFANTSYGTVSLARATELSSNTGYAQVANAIGNEKIIETGKAVGLKNVKFQNTPSMTLGTSSISPLEMAGSFATFAPGGQQRDTIAITEIVSRKGKAIYRHTDSPTEALEPEVAQAVNEVLEGVVKRGTAKGYSPNIDQPVAGKTGTTETYDNLWFCGYTPQLSVAIWTGYNSGQEIKSVYGGHLSNAQLTLPTFKRFMESALAGVAREEFPSTDKKPTYKNNSSWKFKAGNYGESEEDENTDGSQVNEENAAENQPNDNNTTGGTGDNAAGDGGNNGDNNGNNNGGNVEPTPAPDPTPEPNPTPEPTTPSSPDQGN